MQPIAKSPTYLIHNRHSYCFRMAVPKDLQKVVVKRELRYSLKTGYVGIAKQKSRFLAGQMQLIFRFLRQGGTVLSRLSDDQIQELVKQYIKDSIERWDRNFYEVPNNGTPLGESPFEVIDMYENINEPKKVIET
jgi:hypothetical protein